MSDLLKQVEGIAAGSAQTVEQAVPLVAAVAAQAHGVATSHETRLQKLEDIVTQWAPLIEASSALVEKAIASAPAQQPKQGGTTP